MIPDMSLLRILRRGSPSHTIPVPISPDGGAVFPDGERPSGGAMLSAHVHAARLAWWLRDARIRPIQTLAQGLLALPLLPSRIPVKVARQAAYRACRLVSRLYPAFQNTCITRSLVFATLISDREQVVIHIGFRSGNDRGHRTAEGHAWVTLDGNSVGESDPELTLKGASFVRCVELPMERRRVT